HLVPAHKHQPGTDEPDAGNNLRSHPGGSSRTRPGSSTSENPYLLTTTNRAAPSPTRAWVRIPADLLLTCRSSPIRVGSTTAASRHSRTAHQGAWGLSIMGAS